MIMLLRFADGRGKKVSFDRGTMRKKCCVCRTTEKDRPTKRDTIHIADSPSAVQKKGQTVKACPLHAIYYLSAALTSSAELEKIIVEK